MNQRHAIAVIVALAAALLAATAPAAHAQATQATQSASATPESTTPAAAPAASAASAADMVDGLVRKIDADGGKITLRHGEIRHLNMPGMTMVFRVTNPAMLTGVAVGDAVRFRADHVGGEFVVTELVHLPSP